MSRVTGATTRKGKQERSERIRQLPECLNVYRPRGTTMLIKLINHYRDCGYSRSFSIKLADNRDREAAKPLSKPSAEVIARRLMEQNIFGSQK